MKRIKKLHAMFTIICNFYAKFFALCCKIHNINKNKFYAFKIVYKFFGKVQQFNIKINNNIKILCDFE